MRDTFWDTLCASLPLVTVLFGINAVLLVLLLMTSPFLEPGTRTFYVGIASAVVILVSLLGSASVIRRCRKR